MKRYNGAYLAYDISEFSWRDEHGTRFLLGMNDLPVAAYGHIQPPEFLLLRLRRGGGQDRRALERVLVLQHPDGVYAPERDRFSLCGKYSCSPQRIMYGKTDEMLEDERLRAECDLTSLANLLQIHQPLGRGGYCTVLLQNRFAPIIDARR